MDGPYCWNEKHQIRWKTWCHQCRKWRAEFFKRWIVIKQKSRKAGHYHLDMFISTRLWLLLNIWKFPFLGRFCSISDKSESIFPSSSSAFAHHPQWFFDGQPRKKTRRKWTALCRVWYLDHVVCVQSSYLSRISQIIFLEKNCHVEKFWEGPDSTHMYQMWMFTVRNFLPLSLNCLFLKKNHTNRCTCCP